MSDTKLYDPKEVTMVVAGHQVRGLAAEMVRVEPEADDFSDVVGGKGEASRARTSDRRATITFVLQQTSPSNDVLSALAEKDRQTPNGGGVFSVLIKDRQGTTVIRAKEAWVQRRPDVTFSNEVTNREWAVRCADTFYFVGGN